MATWPAGTKFDWRDYAELPDSMVERAEMERGIPKQRRVTSDVREELHLVLHFFTKAEETAWSAWFDTDIHAGQDFFDFPHPRTGATVQARFVGGTKGELKVANKPMQFATRAIKLEYWRSTW